MKKGMADGEEAERLDATADAGGRGVTAGGGTAAFLVLVSTWNVEGRTAGGGTTAGDGCVESVTAPDADGCEGLGAMGWSTVVFAASNATRNVVLGSPTAGRTATPLFCPAAQFCANTPSSRFHRPSADLVKSTRVVQSTAGRGPCS
jgi:hypothetical protein